MKDGRERSPAARRRWQRTWLAGLAVLAAPALVSFACLGPEPEPVTVVDASTDAGGDAPNDAAGDAPPDTAPPSRPFVTTGPGLMLSIAGVTVGAGGLVTVGLTVTDGAGVPLDLPGTYTEGPVSAKWVIAALGPAGDAGQAGQAQPDGGAPSAPAAYAAYTTQPHTSADGTRTAALPDSDTGGTLTEIGIGQGTYSYVFGTKLPAGFDATKTHTVGVWATRVFAGSTYVVNTLYDFVPNGGVATVTATRDVVTTQACNQCHNPLGYHEGGTQRRDARLCVLCHAAPAVDVTNGNALDLPVMIHKIHAGRFLPSVLDGGAYQLTEDTPVSTDAGADAAATRPVLQDHSAAWLPAGGVQNCAACHKGSQGAVWASAPSRAACSSCHDRTSFVYPPPAGWTLHPGGQQKDDSACLSSGCHGASDRYGIASVHATPATDPGAPTLGLTINGVTGTQPGATPVVHFSVTRNGQPLDILGSPLPWLAATIAGPTTDYAQATPVVATIEKGAVTAGLALDGAVGSYAFTFPAPIPAAATGSYALGMEGYLLPSGATPLYRAPYAALNPVAYFAVTDAAPVSRRSVVERAKCNSCHYDLAAHRGTRRSPEYCVMCHTPSAVDDVNAPRFEVPATTVQSVGFKTLVHKIHRGSQLAEGYVIGASPAPTPANPGGTPVDFGKVRFPGDLRACWACHASTTYLPPLPTGLLPTVAEEVLACADPTSTPGAYCANRVVQSQSLVPVLTSACTACHDSPASAAHAQANTAQDGTESCGGCHGAGQAQDVQTVHTLPP